jgi:hypothetical protein
MTSKVTRTISGLALGLAACVIAFSPALAQTTANAAEAKPAAPAAGAYYIEFRAASIGAYGHSYVVYGRLNGHGQPADFHYTDLHPMGNYAIMALGHVLPVPANTSWDPDVAKLPVSSSYRQKLNASQYQNLVAAVRRAQANKEPYWNAITNNCNHYAAALARAAGLRAPTDLQLSYGFVPSLRELNQSADSAKPDVRRKTPAAAAGHGPVTAEQTPRS